MFNIGTTVLSSENYTLPQVVAMESFEALDPNPRTWIDEEYKLFIDGEWVDSLSCETFQTHSPANAPFGGCKYSGFGRETHKLIVDSYSQKKNLYVSLSDAPTGLYQL